MNSIALSAATYSSNLAINDCDELAQFDETQQAILVSRGLVYLTDLAIGNGRFGTIIAPSHNEARHIALRRKQGEKVLGTMAPGFLQDLKNRVQRWRYA